MASDSPEQKTGGLAGFKQWYAGLPAAKRLNLIKGIGIAVAIGLLWLAYGASRNTEKPKKDQATKDVTTVSLGDSRLEDDIRAQFERDRQDMVSQSSQQTKVQNEQAAELTAQQKQLELMRQALESMNGNAPARTRGKAPPDDPEEWANAPTVSGERLNRTASVNAAPPAPPPPPLQFVGDIGVVADPVMAAQRGTAPSTAAKPADSKKNGRRFFLPTSFMPAKLLTGLKAKTVESAKEDPEPMLLRIQAPAVLPNEVRAQLQGCFVIAHGYGSLASERVESRLVSLSCVDYEGRSVIEEEIKGILVDQDGVKGLAGHPVTKMGANLSRMFVAGLVEGAGDALNAATATTSISPLGQTSTIDTSQLGKAGVGKGISTAAGELSKIYAELVRQSSPVIEVGPSKSVSVLITEGVWLEVKDYATEDPI
jgi:conjugal transfer pilus assembly protein TraB